MKSHFRQHRVALSICLAFALLATIYSTNTPPMEGPDEGGHFVYVDYLLKNGALPPLLSYDAMWREGQSTLQAHHPPLYYFMSSVLFLGTEREDMATDYFNINPFASVGTVSLNNLNAYVHDLEPRGDTHIALMRMRFLSISLSTITVLLTYLTAWRLTGDRWSAVLAQLIVVSIPSFVYISGMASNDNLATLLYAAGVYWLVRTWQQRRITWLDALLLGSILGGAALTKLNVLTLFGVVYLGLLLGAWRGRYQWRITIATILGSMALAGLLAGWWYWRNFTLYGDPLALNATQRIWGRGSPPSTLQALLFEARGIWDSFWMILGHFNIRGADWFYESTLLLVSLGSVGVAVTLWRRPQWRMLLSLLLLVVIGTCLALALATRSVNVSQGRILFPMLSSFATLLALGWAQLLGRKLAFGLLLPLLAASLTAPLLLRDAFAYPTPVAALPASAMPTSAQAGELTLLGYQLAHSELFSGDAMDMTLYLRGAHPDNPVLFVKLVDPVTEVPIGGVDTYPGMTWTASWDPDTLYAVQVRFSLDEARMTYLFSRQMVLVVGLRTLDTADLDQVDLLTWTDSNGNSLDTIRLEGPAFINPEYEAPDAGSISVEFGDRIELTNYDVDTLTAVVGEGVTITTHWRSLADLTQNWTLSVGVLDDENNLVAQADGNPAYFPTRHWQRGLQHTDVRSLPLPDALAPGNYRLYLAWYDRSSGERLLPVGNGADTQANLWLFPDVLTVTR